MNTDHRAELIRLLRERDLSLGGDGVVYDESAVEAIYIAPGTYVGFCGDNYAVVIDPEQKHYTRDVVRALGVRLRTMSPIRAAVHHRNVASIIANRRLGAEWIGVDDQGYHHYLLTREGFRYGKTICSAAAEPAADQ